jgi:2-oxoglutarate dehydrogenase complex dehydrogenase (E1) component-like enzyme
VLDDPEAGDRGAALRVLVTSGRLFYALFDSRRERPDTRSAIVRVEQIYPFPRTELVELFAHYPNAREIRWVQEEPANMGAWRHIRHRLENVLPQGTTLAMIARKAVPAPATGYYPIHLEEEKRILDRAFDPAPSPVRVTTVAPLERRS